MNAWGKAIFHRPRRGECRDFSHQVYRVATSDAFGDSFIEAGANPPTCDAKNFTVTLPESFKKSFAMLMESGAQPRVGRAVVVPLLV